MIINLNEATAARRRIPIVMFDETDGITEETGKTLTVTVSKAGASYASAGGSVTEVGNGLYYYQCSTTEVNTEGILNIRATASGCRNFYGHADVVDLSKYKADVSALATDATLIFYLTAAISGYQAEHATILAAIAALNDLSSSDVQGALTSQGYTTTRAAKLDNLDATVSSRSSHSAPDLSNLDVAVSTRASASAVSALNDLSSSDVQGALTSQGLTSVRAALLDNLDAAVSSRSSHSAPDLSNLDAAISTRASAASVAALNDLSSSDVQGALTSQGYTTTRAAKLDNLDATVSSRSSHSAPDLSNLDAAISSRASQVSLDALNDISSSDVSTAVASSLTAQGLTTVRAALLDYLDAAVSSRSSHGAPDLSNLDAAISTRASAASVAALNDLSSSDVQGAMTSQGYTTTRAAKLDNLDATVSSRSSHAEPDLSNLDAAISSRASQVSVDALNDVSTGDISTAVTAGLTSQGYTSARATKIDNLDATVSSRSSHSAPDLSNLDAAVSSRASAASVSALNDISAADVKAQADQALVDIGATSARMTKVDNLDAAVTTRASQSSVDTVDGNVDLIYVGTANIISSLASPDTFKADVSGLASQSSVDEVKKLINNKAVLNTGVTPNTLTIYDDDGTTPLIVYNVTATTREPQP